MLLIKETLCPDEKQETFSFCCVTKKHNWREFTECLLHIKYIAVGVGRSIKNSFNTKQNALSTINERS